MELQYQLILLWGIPCLLTALLDRFVPSDEVSQTPEARNRLSWIIFVGLLLYSILLLTRPVFVLVLATTVLLVLAWTVLYNHQPARTSPIVSESLSYNRFLIYLGLCLLLALVLRLHRIGTFGLLIDEPWHFKTAVGYLETGHFQFWDFYKSIPRKDYSRAWLFTWQVAMFLKAFGRTLLVGRLVSLVWGMLVFVPLFAYSRFLKLTRLQIIFVFLLATLSPFLILSSRWVRHYSMYTALYLAVVVIIGRTLQMTSWKAFFSYGAVAAGGLFILLHLHPAPTLILVLSTILFLIGSIIGTPNGTTKHPMRYPALYTFLIAVIGGGLFLGLTGEAQKFWRHLMTLFAEELALPSFLNLLYGFYATSLSLGAGLGGILTGAMIVTAQHRMERFFVVQLLVPIALLFFLNRPIPLVRYTGHLIPLAIPLLVLAFSRLQTAVDLPTRVMKMTVIFVLVIVPISQFHHQLDRIWSGHQDYVSFLGDDAQHYNRLIDLLKQSNNPDRAILLLDVPSFHADQLKGPGLNTDYRSFFEERVPLQELKSLACKQNNLWVVAAYAYRDPTRSPVEDYLRENFRSITVPEIHGINLYYKTGGSANCR